MLKDVDEVTLLDIIAGDQDKDDCYYAIRFAFWCVVIMCSIAVAAGLAIAFKCI